MGTIELARLKLESKETVDTDGLPVLILDSTMMAKLAALGCRVVLPFE
jgi:hypothetical protein